jgi:long-chain acyl-CoA synthetase
VTGLILSGARELTRAAMQVNAARAARGFAALGVGETDAVALMLRNDFPFLEASLAANLLGAYAVPINWHFRQDEAGYILADCGAKALVVHADLWPQVIGAVPAGCTVLVVPTPPEIGAAYGVAPETARVPAGMTEWSDWLGRHAPWDGPPLPSRGSMIYTSGTTGRPKGVRRQPTPPEQQAAGLVRLAQIFGIKAGMRIAVTGPMYHSAPNAYGRSAGNEADLVVLQPRFEPEELLALVARHQLTGLHLVPTMFVRLLRLPEAVKQKYDVSSLQFVVHAAAPCPVDVKRAMIAWWGPVITEYYGSTESGPVTFCTSVEYLAHPGTVGRAVSEAELVILNDNGEVQPIGEVGEIYMRHSGLQDFTYHRQDARRREIERHGFITNGDVGYLDRDGYLYLCDRKKDMVISGGVNIYPAEIEAVLLAMPGVQDCAVFGIPDAEFGEALAAVVQPHAPLTAEQVRAYLRERMAGYKVPKLVEFQAELPREDSGKIFKRKLRDPYWAKAGRAI